MSDPDKTGPKQNGVTLFKPGQSGNPKGRPKGAKSKLTESFWQDMADVWAIGGRMAVEAALLTDPVAFVKIAATLMPKETEVTLRTLTASQLSDDELANIAVGSSEDADPTPLDPSKFN